MEYRVKKVLLAYETSKDITKMDPEIFRELVKDLDSNYPKYLSVVNKNVYSVELPTLNFLTLYESTVFVSSKLLVEAEYNEAMELLTSSIDSILRIFFENLNINYKEQIFN